MTYDHVSIKFMASKCVGCIIRTIQSLTVTVRVAQLLFRWDDHERRWI